MATNQYISQALAYQDLERLQFSKNLRANPGDYNNYTKDRVDQLADEIYNRKRAAFQKAHIDLARYMDLDHNANFYKARAGDVDRLTTSMSANNESVKQKLERDADVSRRQFEINEWQNQNKLETLFFLQVFFIVALLMACVIYLQKSGAMTYDTAALITILLAVVVGALGVYRYYYTRRVRDGRLWSRRYFGKEEAPKPALTCGGGEITLDTDALLDSLLPAGVKSCSSQAYDNFNKWQDNLTDTMAAYQEDGKPPASVFGKAGSLGGSICSELNTNEQ